MNEVDMIIQSLDYERAFWSNAKFVCRLGQGGTIGWINVRAPGIDARVRQGQHLDGGNLRKQWFTFSAGDGDYSGLVAFTTEHDEIGTSVGFAAKQQRGDGIYCHWPVVVLYADPAIGEWNQVFC